MQTLSFNSRGWTKYNIKCLGITTIFIHSPHVQGLKCNWTNKYNTKMFIFNILMRILCRQWLPWVWNSWTSPETGFPPLWCFARLLLQLTSVVVCLRVFLPLVLSSVSEMHAQSGWDQEIDLVIFLFVTYITSSEMYSLHLTHPKWTHTRSSGQPCYMALGSSWGFGALLEDTSVVVLKEERTIPARPEIRTHNLWITSPTL